MLIIVFSTDPNGPAGPPGDSGNVVGGVSLSSPHKKRPKRVLLLHVYLVSVPNDNLFYLQILIVTTCILPPVQPLPGPAGPPGNPGPNVSHQSEFLVKRHAVLHCLHP